MSQTLERSKMYGQGTIGASLHHYYANKWLTLSIIIYYANVNEVTVLYF